MQIEFLEQMFTKTNTTLTRVWLPRSQLLKDEINKHYFNKTPVTVPAVLKRKMRDCKC